MSVQSERRGGSDHESEIRNAVSAEVKRICEFGDAHIRSHYAPLIGENAADQQVLRWWNLSQIESAVDRGLIVVAEAAGEITGVAQRGWTGSDHVLYKLYLDPTHRGRGLGPALIEAVLRQLPSTARRLCVEHFAGNVRAAGFYEREGFTVERVEKSAGGAALDVIWRARAI